MGTPRFDTGPYHPEIDHPLQDGWLFGGNDVLTGIHKSMLGERFQHSDIHMETLYKMVDLASVRTDSYRQTKETENIALLGLTGAERAEYASLVARPEYIGKYVKLFSAVGAAAIQKGYLSENAQAVTLEIGGRRQGGDWDCTKALDDMVRTIPGQLHTPWYKLWEWPRARVDRLDSDQVIRRNYSFMPLYTSADHRYGYDFGLLRRQRAVADVALGKRPRVEISKESMVLVVMAELDLKTEEAVREQHEVAHAGEDNAPSALILGTDFEKVAADKIARNKDTRMVPISAEYRMRMRV